MSAYKANTPVVNAEVVGCSEPCCPHCSAPVSLAWDDVRHVELTSCPQCGWETEVAAPNGSWFDRDGAELPTGEWEWNDEGVFIETLAADLVAFNPAPF